MKIFWALLLFSCIIYMGYARLNSVITSRSQFIKTLEPIIKHPLATYDEKMSFKYPIYYDFIQEIRNNTPNNCTIYVPHTGIPYPKAMWAIDLMQLTQTALYPRKVVSIEKYIEGSDDEKSYKIFIHGEGLEEYPESSIVILKTDEDLGKMGLIILD